MAPTSSADRFIGLAFPVVKVRYAGPSDSSGSRYIASCEGTRVTHPYDDACSASMNAHAAAHRCWEKRRALLRADMKRNNDFGDDFYTSFDQTTADAVFIPGDLSPDSYAFTVVPAGYLTGTEA